MKSPLLSCACILTLVFLCGCASLRADDAASAPPPGAIAAPITDPAQVDQHLRAVLARPEFQETEETAVNTRIEDWLSQWFNRLGATIGDFKYASSMPAFESLLMTLLVVFSISVLLYIIIRLTRRRARMDPESETALPEHKALRSPESYDGEIEAATRAGDWHAAWLASWRQFLSRLEHRHLVEADRTRTNREYLEQLRAKTIPGSAVDLLTGMVVAYDRFIYGRQAIGEPDWKRFHRQIDEAALMLHLDDRKTAAAHRTSP